MASAGTLISDLDGATPTGGSDTDIVAQIMADMNAGGNIPASSNIQQQHALPPAPSGRATGPNPNSMLQNTIDPNVATAHIIGNRQPTPADFAAMMGSAGGPGGVPYSSLGAAGPSGFPYQSQQQQQYYPQGDSVNASTGIASSLFPSGNLLKELKTPILVAIIFCIMSLPVINVMIGHYFPRLLRIGGDLTVMGLAVKSLMAGGAFFIIQRVFVPLVTN
jgi:hypothetical protein